MKYIIKIPEPCNEKWEEMSLTERGRYCKVCQKEIYDFTKVSNFELIKRLDKGESVCGRFRKSQLDVELDSLKDVSYLGRVALFLGLTSLVGISTEPAQAQSVPHTPVQLSDTIVQPQKKQQVTVKNEDVVIIKGRVFADSIANVNSLPGVSVSYENKLDTISVHTDAEGKFELKIPQKEFTPNIELDFSSIGFKSHTCLADKDVPYFEVVMENEVISLGGVFIEYTRPTLWQRFKNLFRRKNKE